MVIGFSEELDSGQDSFTVKSRFWVADAERRQLFQ